MLQKLVRRPRQLTSIAHQFGCLVCFDCYWMTYTYNISLKVAKSAAKRRNATFSLSLHFLPNSWPRGQDKATCDQERFYRFALPQRPTHMALPSMVNILNMLIAPLWAQMSWCSASFRLWCLLDGRQMAMSARWRCPTPEMLIFWLVRSLYIQAYASRASELPWRPFASLKQRTFVYQTTQSFLRRDVASMRRRQL